MTEYQIPEPEGVPPAMRAVLAREFGEQYVARYLARRALSPEEQLEAGLIDMAELRRMDARASRHRWGDWRTWKQHQIEDLILLLSKEPAPKGRIRERTSSPGKGMET